MNWELVISAVGLLVAAIALGEAIRSRIRSEKSAREADMAAEKSADAAQRSARAAESSADALQRSVALNEAEAAENERIRWSLDHFDGEVYMLQNTSQKTAHSVRIDSIENVISNEPIEKETIEGRNRVRLMISRSLRVMSPKITVQWFDEPFGVNPSQQMNVNILDVPPLPK